MGVCVLCASLEEGVFFRLGCSHVVFHSAASGRVKLGRVVGHFLESFSSLFLGEMCALVGLSRVVVLSMGPSFFVATRLFVPAGGVFEALLVFFNGSGVGA